MASRNAAAQNASSTLAIIKAQIQFLLSTLNEENFAKNEREINALIDAHGSEANSHLIRKLILQSHPALAASPSAASNTPLGSQLALRLLISSVRKLARDPLVTHRFREAILAGLNDTSSGSSSTEAFRLLGEHLTSFCDRAAFSGLERLILALEMCRVLILPPNAQAQPQPTSTKIALALHAKSKDFGIAAVRLVRDSWPSGIEGLAAGQGADSFGPVGLSRVLDRIASDWKVDLIAGEMGIWSEDDPTHSRSSEALLDVESKRDLVRAIRARLGRELATQVTIHSFEGMEFCKSTTTADILHRLIPDTNFCTADLVRAIVAKHAKVVPPSSDSEHQIITLFTDLIRLASQSMDNFGIDMGVFVRVLSEHLPQNFTWGTVLLRLFDTNAHLAEDQEDPLPDVWGLKVVAGLLLSSSHAVSALWSTWEHPDRQLALISRLLGLSNDTFPLGSVSEGRRILGYDDVAQLSQNVRPLGQSAINSTCNSTDLVRTLLRLSLDPNLEYSVKECLEKAALGANGGELLLIGIVSADKINATLQMSLTDKLLQMFLASTSASHQVALQRLWQFDRQLILRGLVNLYSDSELNIARIVDFAHELHVLPEILDLRPYRLALDAAALSHRREYLDLARWLQNVIGRMGAVFVKETLAFVGSKVRYELRRNETDPPPESTTMPVVADAIAIFMRSLRMNHELFSAEDVEHFKDIRTLSLQLHPRLLNFAPGADQEPGISVATFPPEIEADVDATFKRMYDGEISVDDVVKLLQHARDSKDARRIDFYQCMLHGLMDEMRFVATYPPQELLLTAHLFGSLIQQQVLHHQPLGIAVRYVLDALKHPPASASYTFGITALARFQSRLQEWPQLASALLAIGHVESASPEVANYAKMALAEPGSAEALALQEAMGIRPDSPLPPAFPALQIKEASGPIEAPPADISDKILFIVNNLSPTNVESKVVDMAPKLKEEHFRWFANYLVAQRVCIEPNNHGLYLHLVDALAYPNLNKHILSETYIKSSALLNAEQTVSSSTDRTLLKNLGAWLGAITLARDKPIRHASLSFKDLLMQGYDNERLIVAMPFVCKILEQSSKSRVFKPPNPWLMGILRLLVELYQFGKLKLNLRFEVEVLCKSLNIDIGKLEPTTILRNSLADREEKSKMGKVSHPLNTNDQNLFYSQDINNQDGHQRAPQVQQPVMLSGQAGYSLGLQDSIHAALQSLPGQVVFNPALSFVANSPNFKRIVLTAIDHAIREIIVPVVERSVTIAGISTRELTAKDFAMEGDQQKLRHAAHLMVQNLAGSLALVTCKEPLRLSILNHLKTLILADGTAGNNFPEQAFSVIANENLEVACSIVERVAMEKAVSEVDEALREAYALRRKHNESAAAATGTAFWDTSAMAASHYSGMLPEPLKLKLNGLSSLQLQVYDDFARVRHLEGADGVVEDVTADSNRSGLQNAGLLTVQQALDQFNHIITELDAAINSATADTIASLPSDSDIPLVLTQMPTLAARSFHVDQTTLACSQKVVQLLYKAQSLLGREVYSELLRRLCSMSNKVSRDLVSWIIYAEDERKYDVPATVSLLRHGIVPLLDFEANLAKSIVKDFRPSTVDFAAKFVRALLSDTPPLASREQVGHVIDALLQASRAEKATDASVALLQDLRFGVSSAATARQELENQEIKDQLTKFFITWVRAYQQSANTESSFVEYVVKLQEHGILKGEDLSSRFFRTCTEVSVDSYIKQKAAGGTIASGIFQPVDALGCLLAFMVKYHGDGSDKGAAGEAKAFYLTKVLSIVVLVLAQAHEEMGVHFAVAQKPFYRFFSAILSNLHAIEPHLGVGFSRILVALGHSINTLQPFHFPGFAFSWTSLISHRLFMPKMLKERECQASYHRLLLSLLKFVGPLVKNDGGFAGHRESVKSLYNATCRIFLVLLHDHPEFLVGHHATLCDAIPTTCLQLQNIVLSAFPTDVTLPDPCTPNVSNDPVFDRAPLMLTDYAAVLMQQAEVAETLEKAFQSGPEAKAIEKSDLERLKRWLTHTPSPTNADGSDEPVIIRRAVSALVIVLIGAATNGVNKSQSSFFDETHPSAILLSRLVNSFDAEGRYYILFALANELRYPNTYTRWASAFIIHLFEDSETEDLTREIITRVLLERMCTIRPHPFGLVMTQVELLRRCKLEEQPFFQRADLKPLLPLVDRMRLVI